MTRTPYVNLPRASVAMGGAGAIVGGAVAAARNYDKVKNKEITREEAVKDVVRESSTTGLATATATAFVGVMGLTGLLSLAGIVVVTAGTKNLADKMLDSRQTPRALPAEAGESPSSGKAAKSRTKK